MAGGKQKAMFSGTREAGALGNFYLLMMQANTTDVCAIPTEGWYNFRPDAPRRVLTLEEAEEALERRAHNQTATTAFMERMKREGAANDGALANILSNLGEIYLLLGDPGEAYRIRREVLKLARRMTNHSLTCQARTAVGAALLCSSVLCCAVGAEVGAEVGAAVGCSAGASVGMPTGRPSSVGGMNSSSSCSSSSIRLAIVNSSWTSHHLRHESTSSPKSWPVSVSRA